MPGFGRTSSQVDPRRDTPAGPVSFSRSRSSAVNFHAAAARRHMAHLPVWGKPI